ncbi:topoisomerase [Aquaspirillum sp. LM1]|jgi:competence protein ComEA|uniref:ComEA family DNA-binding protein n=1 Tax=Aquaspirillum sp. LM1 TaxID=1938604 RepID=UPI000983A770|nr:helix-hairpin-helix domain-containing protein [Aquaspirillum sp. LM1]AQR65708.1 topoisomerase [Aquaspirillum sp. LM1]
MKKLLVMLASVFAFSTAFAAVDLNTATQQDLETVKGIGPAKSKAILEYRSKNGPFKSVDDLAKVPGFGEKSVAGMKAELAVGAAKPAAAAAKPAAPAAPAAKPAAAPAAPAKPAEPVKKP